MSEAPEEIWLDWRPGLAVTQGPLAGPPRTPYTRADHCDALVKAAREEALREAADKVREWQAFTKYAQEPIAEEMAQDVLALIEKDKADG